jgi:hypothetical protein
VSFAGAQPGSGDFIDESRCPAVRFDVRCQLQVDHEVAGPHVAMVRHSSSRRSGFAIWADDGRSAWTSDVGQQHWAATFPRVA